MKNYLTIVFLLNQILAFSQPWLNKYDLPDWKAQETTSFCTDYDSGYLLNISVANFIPALNQHCLIQKIDDNSSKLYNLKIGNDFTQGSSADFIRGRRNNELIIAGSTWDESYESMPLLMKLDSCYNKIWCSVLSNSPLDDFFVDAIVLEDSSIIAVSMYNDPDIDRPLFIHKFDNSGQQIWRKEVAGGHPEMSSVMVWNFKLLSDGGFLITGTCYWPDPEPNSPAYARMFLSKTDSEGNETAFYVHGINDYISTYGVTSEELNGKIYTGGLIFLGGDIPTKPHLFINDLSLNLLWDTTLIISNYNGRRAEVNLALSEPFNSSFFAVVKMYLPNPNDEGVPAVIKIDTTGGVTDFFMYSDTTLSSADIPEITHDNKILISGGYGAPSAFYKFIYIMRLIPDSLRIDSISGSNYSYDTICPDSIENMTIPIENCRIIVSNDDYKPPLKSYNLEMEPSPVPTSDALTIRYSSTLLYRNIWIKCYNLLGEMIYEFSVNSGIFSTDIDVSSWKPGLYLAVAFSNDIRIGSCKFIVN